MPGVARSALVGTYVKGCQAVLGVVSQGGRAAADRARGLVAVGVVPVAVAVPRSDGVLVRGRAVGQGSVAVVGQIADGIVREGIAKP